MEIFEQKGNFWKKESLVPEGDRRGKRRISCAERSYLVHQVFGEGKGEKIRMRGKNFRARKNGIGK